MVGTLLRWRWPTWMVLLVMAAGGTTIYQIPKPAGDVTTQAPPQNGFAHPETISGKVPPPPPLATPSSPSSTAPHGHYRTPTDARRRVKGSTPGLPLEVGGSGEYHRHAHASQQLTHQGIRTTLSVWAPDPSPGTFSLSQTWITGTKNGVLQTIESGWQVYPTFHGDSEPHLFVFFTNHNYDQGSGWYDFDQTGGFVQLPDSAAQSWKVGGKLSDSGVRTSTTTLPSKLGIQWQQGSAGDWYLYLSRDGVNFDTVGYYPALLFKGGALSGPADTADFGGEVCGAMGGAPSTATGQMGSGQPATGGPYVTAFHSAVFVLPAGTSKLAPAKLSPQVDSYDSPYYSVLTGTTKGLSFFYFGGTSAP